MPHVIVRKRWLVPALTCPVILAGMAWCGVRWNKSDRPMGPLQEGQAAYEHRDWQAAERKALEQLRNDRGDLRALRLLGRALYRQAHDQAAAGIFQRLGRETMTAEDCLLVGQSCIRSRKIELAIKVWQKAVRLDPNHFESRIASSRFISGWTGLKTRSERPRVFRPSPGGMLSPSSCWARFAARSLTRPAPLELASAPWNTLSNGRSWSSRMSFASNWLAAFSRQARLPSLASS